MLEEWTISTQKRASTVNASIQTQNISFLKLMSTALAFCGEFFFSFSFLSFLVFFSFFLSLKKKRKEKKKKKKKKKKKIYCGTRFAINLLKLCTLAQSSRFKKN